MKLLFLISEFVVSYPAMCKLLIEIKCISELTERVVKIKKNRINL